MIGKHVHALGAALLVPEDNAAVLGCRVQSRMRMDVQVTANDACSSNCKGRNERRALGPRQIWTPVGDADERLFGCEQRVDVVRSQQASPG